MSPLRGIALKLISVFLFMVMASMIKATADEVPPGEAVFFRSFFALPVILVWLATRRKLSTGLKVKNVWGHVARGVIGVTAMGSNFTALGILPLPEVTAIGYAAPMLTVVFAAMLLGERVRAFRLTAVCVGLLGVLIVLWPRLSFASDPMGQAALWGVFFVLLSATCRALVQVHMRRMVQTESTSAIVFWFSITSTVFALFTLPFGWTVPTLSAVLLLVLSGLIGGIAQIFITSAYRFGEAGLLAPFDYASILFALIIGYVVFDEVPTTVMLIGSAVVVASGIAIIWRERQLGMRRARERRGITPHG